MQMQKFEFLVEVAKTGSISIAAENLHVSQSGISQAIKKMEEELCVKIFNRSRLGVTLTKDGLKIVEKANEILSKYEELKEEARKSIDTHSIELKVSMIPAFINHLIPLIMEFKNLYSNVNIEILENTTEKTLESIQKNSIDIGLICRYGDILKDMENLDFNGIHEGKMKVYVNSDSPFAAKKQITPDEILQQKVILYNGDYIRWFINNFQYHLGKLNIVFTSNHTGEILRSISNGVAISFAPDFSIKNSPFLLEGKIVEVDIINYEPIDVTLGLVRSKKKRISNVENTFFQFLESKMSDYFR